jgi:glycerol-3-phosphate dehydrogenase
MRGLIRPDFPAPATRPHCPRDIMEDRRNNLAGGQFDIVVIGAGIFGACLAWEAARRGYSVAVIDKGDFGHATSSNHFRFIHGGIRYLQHLDLVRVRESSEERSALVRLAPHLCYPMPIVFPTYGHGRKGKGLMRAAMAAYDLLTLDRNRGIRDPSRRTPNGTVLSRADVMRMFPGVPTDKLTGAALFHDGQMYNPARLVLAFLQSAASHGAVVANYVQAEQLLHENGRITGCAANDLLSGERFELRGKMVINAAGPWGRQMLAGVPGLKLEPDPSFSRDLAFVVHRSVCPGHAVGCQAATADSDAILDRGARHLFLVPWRGMTLVGVWHGYTEVAPDNVGVSREELQNFLDEINAGYAGLDLRMDDIRMIYTGLILFGSRQDQGATAKHSFSKRALVFDHARDGIEGLVTVIGDRATVARRVAEKTIRLVAPRLGGQARARKPDWEPVHGGAIDDFPALVNEIRQRLPGPGQRAATALAHNYGTAYVDVLACATQPSHLAPLGDSNVLAAEVLHAVRHELATSLEDIVIRRTELGSGGDPGAEALAQAAELAAGEFGWNRDETAAQVAALQTVFARHGPWRLVDRSDQLEPGVA